MQVAQDQGHVDALAAGVDRFLLGPVDGPRFKMFHTYNIIQGRIKGYRVNHSTCTSVNC